MDRIPDRVIDDILAISYGDRAPGDLGESRRHVRSTIALILERLGGGVSEDQCRELYLESVRTGWRRSGIDPGAQQAGRLTALAVKVFGACLEVARAGA